MLELALTIDDASNERLGHWNRHQTAVVVVDRLAVVFGRGGRWSRTLGGVAWARRTVTSTAQATGQALRPGRLHLAVTVSNGHSIHAHIITFIQRINKFPIGNTYLKLVFVNTENISRIAIHPT